MSKKWNVWSKDAATGAWMGIDSGTEKEAKDGAARRMATAKRHGLEVEYVALPDGEQPQ